MISADASGFGPAGKRFSMYLLNDLRQRVLHAIVTAPLAWQAPSQLASRLGLGLDDTVDTIADLDDTGWIEPWEMGEAIFITLSPTGAERLRVRLVMIGRSDAMRWASIDEPEPEPPRASGRHEGLSALNFVADAEPGPELAVELSERAMRIALKKAEEGDATWIDFLPRPLILIGSGLSPWPGPRRPSAQTLCPACHSQPLLETAYCLICDRWGLDHLLPSRRTLSAAPRPIRNPTIPSANPSEAKAARRAKRRRKWAETLARKRKKS